MSSVLTYCIEIFLTQGAHKICLVKGFVFLLSDAFLKVLVDNSLCMDDNSYC